MEGNPDNRREDVTAPLLISPSTWSDRWPTDNQNTHIIHSITRNIRGRMVIVMYGGALYIQQDTGSSHSHHFLCCHTTFLGKLGGDPCRT